MTKKSPARLQRDREAAIAESTFKHQLAQNTCWKDLIEIYNKCVGMLAQHAMLKEAFTKELIAEVSPADSVTLVENIRLLASDLARLSTELSQLHAQHADKSGGTTDPNDVMRSVEIFEQYNLFIERHNACVLPTAYQIMEAMGAAEKSLMAKQQIADVNVITDVEVKEVPKKERQALHVELDVNDPNPQQTIDAVVAEASTAVQE